MPSHPRELEARPPGIPEFPPCQSIRTRDWPAALAVRLVGLDHLLRLSRHLPFRLFRLRLVVVRFRTVRSKEWLQLRAKFAFGASFFESVKLSQGHYMRFV